MCSPYTGSISVASYIPSVASMLPEVVSNWNLCHLIEFVTFVIFRFSSMYFIYCRL